jgi:hypothetical protein
MIGRKLVYRGGILVSYGHENEIRLTRNGDRRCPDREAHGYMAGAMLPGNSAGQLFPATPSGSNGAWFTTVGAPGAGALT